MRFPGSPTDTAAVTSMLAASTPLSSKVVLLDWDLESGVVALSPSWPRLLGHGSDARLGGIDAWQRHVHPHDRERVLAFLRSCREQRWPTARLEFRMQHHDGSDRWILLRLSTVVDAANHPTRIIGGYVDLTEWKRTFGELLGQMAVVERIAAGAPLRHTLESLIAMIESQDPGVLGAILVLDRETQRLRCAAAPGFPSGCVASIDGVPIGEGLGVCGTAAHRRLPVLVTDIEQDPLCARFRELARGHGIAACWSAPILDPRGELLGTFALYFRDARMPNERHPAFVEIACHFAALAISRAGLAAAEEAQPSERGAGRTASPSSANAPQPRSEGASDPILPRADAGGLHAKRLENLGKLAAGVAHDFNNVLTAIAATAELALRNPSLPAQLRTDLETIADATQRGADIARQLLTFARKPTPAPVPVDVNHAIRSLQRMLDRLAGDRIAIVTELASREATICIDPTHLDQAIVNLVTNARDATPGHGTITIATCDRVLAEGDLDRPSHVPPGAYVCVLVKDAGAGIDEALLTRIFEPFFTTKPEDEGTGLGLALVSTIVTQHGGFIDVQSAIAAGSCFTLYLPRSVASPARRAEPPAERSLNGTETLLVVEDDPILLELLQRSLAAHGHRVLAANAPSVARELFAAHRDDVQLLITDAMMPMTPGKALYDELRAARADLPVLYLSGYPADELVRKGLLGEGDMLLAKPFTPAKLLELVRDMLDG